MLSRVPEITLYFWLIKVLCTTVGETAADFLNVNLNFGLTGTSVVTGLLLAVALFFQFRANKYVPGIYWLAVALISVFGTLVTDNLTDALGVPLEFSTILFGILLALTFGAWYAAEKTLSIHSIFTRRREAFYWLAILFTFALGTAAGDLMAEGLGLGYGTTGLIVAGVIAAAAIAWRLKLNSILAFWVIYILTRPLGASIGDYLSQPASHGGLGLGATATSAIFLSAIVAVVVHLSVAKRDVIHGAVAELAYDNKEKGGLWQTTAVVGLFIIAGGVGYEVLHGALQSDSGIAEAGAIIATSTGAASASPLGDLSTFRTIVQDTLDKLNAGDQAGATARVDDLEYEWDNAQSRLKPRSAVAWNAVDGKIDTVLHELRAVRLNPASEKTALEALLAAFQ
ncbi:MAG: hypothetical protein JWL87_520 [Candidatus Adlerbacteria bacterium]|nr:hypothetical protein [Candidatus Adlerbacteria bacterium]